jgi:hypothetical protein
MKRPIVEYTTLKKLIRTSCKGLDILLINKTIVSSIFSNEMFFRKKDSQRIS